MQELILSVLSLIILVPIIYFVPLGLTNKGKAITVVAAFLLANLGLLTQNVLPLWVIWLVLALVVFLVTYLLQGKFQDVLFAGMPEESSSSETMFETESSFAGETDRIYDYHAPGSASTGKDSDQQEDVPQFSVQKEATDVDSFEYEVSEITETNDDQTVFEQMEVEKEDDEQQDFAEEIDPSLYAVHESDSHESEVVPDASSEFATDEKEDEVTEVTYLDDIDIEQLLEVEPLEDEAQIQAVSEEELPDLETNFAEVLVEEDNDIEELMQEASEEDQAIDDLSTDLFGFTDEPVSDGEEDTEITVSSEDESEASEINIDELLLEDLADSGLEEELVLETSKGDQAIDDLSIDLFGSTDEPVSDIEGETEITLLSEVEPGSPEISIDELPLEESADSGVEEEFVPETGKEEQVLDELSTGLISFTDEPVSETPKENEQHQEQLHSGETAGEATESFDETLFLSDDDDDLHLEPETEEESVTPEEAEFAFPFADAEPDTDEGEMTVELFDEQESLIDDKEEMIFTEADVPIAEVESVPEDSEEFVPVAEEGSLTSSQMAESLGQAVVTSAEEAQQETSEETRALQQQMFHLLTSQLELEGKRLPAHQYEFLIKEHMVDDLSPHDYYTFASMLTEHYIRNKELGKLEDLLCDLRERFAKYPILAMEIQYLYEQYCKKAL